MTRRRRKAVEIVRSVLACVEGLQDRGPGYLRAVGIVEDEIEVEFDAGKHAGKSEFVTAFLESLAAIEESQQHPSGVLVLIPSASSVAGPSSAAAHGRSR